MTNTIASLWIHASCFITVTISMYPIANMMFWLQCDYQDSVLISHIVSFVLLTLHSSKLSIKLMHNKHVQEKLVFLSSIFTLCVYVCNPIIKKYLYQCDKPFNGSIDIVYGLYTMALLSFVTYPTSDWIKEDHTIVQIFADNIVRCHPVEYNAIISFGNIEGTDYEDRNDYIKSCDNYGIYMLIVHTFITSLSLSVAIIVGLPVAIFATIFGIEVLLLIVVLRCKYKLYKEYLVTPILPSDASYVKIKTIWTLVVNLFVAHVIIAILLSSCVIIAVHDGYAELTPQLVFLVVEPVIAGIATIVVWKQL